MLSGVVTYDYTPGTPVVPEPSTWAMLIGFACLGSAALRRKDAVHAISA